jgi:single-strand DNA-binding protein
MDMNLIVLAGRLAAPTELREFESGSTMLRSLITVRSEVPRRRVDVVPVILWDPGDDHELVSAPVGSRVFAVGAVQRRFWTDSERERRSRIEVVAQHAELVKSGAFMVATHESNGAELAG